MEHIPPHAGGKDHTQAPFLVLSMPLPDMLAGHRLGDAVTGQAPSAGLSNFYGIEHVAMTVPDFEAAIRFFEEAFGATVLYRHIKASDKPATYEQVGRINGLAPGTAMTRACQLRFANGPNIELFQLEGYGRKESAGINDMGLVHVSVIVEDIHLAGARFVKAGGTMLEGPFDLGFNEVGPGNQNWFGQTPWGSWIEFMTFRAPLRYDPGAVAQRWFPVRA
jgi:catechol 2,3-dioxygenase-like lactoylglutathione lyase family enzyme